MTELTLEKAIKILGLSEDDTLLDAKKAYKRQMHRSHPDRFPNDIDAQKRASSKFLQLKECYKLVEEHYELYGEMPIIVKGKAQPKKKKKSRKDEAEDQAFQRSAPFYQEPKPSIAKKARIPKIVAQPREKKSNAGKITVATLVIGALGYLGIHQSHFLNQNEFGDKTRTEIDSSELDKRVKMQLDPQYHSNPAQDDHLIEEKEKARAVLSQVTRKRKGKRNKTFSVGSSYNDVAEIHGAPDRSDENTWYYETSMIVFDNDGKVINWTSTPAYPLSTSIK